MQLFEHPSYNPLCTHLCSLVEGPCDDESYLSFNQTGLRERNVFEPSCAQLAAARLVHWYNP